VGRPQLRWEDITNEPLLLLLNRQGWKRLAKTRTSGGKLLSSLMQAVMPLKKWKKRMRRRNRQKRRTESTRERGEKEEEKEE
jgi:hypothetical protein